MRIVLFLVLLSALALSVRAEQLFKPIPAPAGEVKQGLQASVKPVKPEFGPGESIVVRLEIRNISAEEQTFALDRKGWRNLSIQACRGAQPISNKLLSDDTTLDYKIPTIRFEPGASRAYCIDLRALDYVKPQAFEELGLYHIKLVDQSGLGTDWVHFRISHPGERRPELAPEQAERLQAWIAQLGDAEPQRRGAAALEIARLGKAALSALEAAAAAEQNGERRERILELIRSLTAPPPVTVPVRPHPPKPQLPPNPQRPLPPPDLEF